MPPGKLTEFHVQCAVWQEATRLTTADYYAFNLSSRLKKSDPSLIHGKGNCNCNWSMVYLRKRIETGCRNTEHYAAESY